MRLERVRRKLADLAARDDGSFHQGELSCDAAPAGSTPPRLDDQTVDVVVTSGPLAGSVFQVEGGRCVAPMARGRRSSIGTRRGSPADGRWF